MISEHYRGQNAQLHALDPQYGSKGGKKYYQAVRDLMRLYEGHTVLDYGCGKGSLRRMMGKCVQNYDPAFPQWAGEPNPADVVICSDVLEHIEPEFLDDVIQHLHKLTKKVGLFVIACRPAAKQLPDGRNTHLIVKDEDWWKAKLEPFFSFVTDERPHAGELYLVVQPK